MKYYIIAGEASGDLHASNLMKELKKQDSSAQFRCWGGDLMKQQGATLVKHYRDLAFMGFIEVIANLKAILNNIKFCKKDIFNYKPDAVILVDYPGFNMRIAEFAHKAGFKVFYYISPQVWAWKESRVYKIKKFVNRMFVILPFEKEFYTKYDFEVDFVGHPLLDMIEQLPENKPVEFRKNNKIDDKPFIALLPGSRKQEIKKMLPIMLSVTSEYSDYGFLIAGAPGVEKEFYEQFTPDNNVSIVYNQTHELLRNADAAIVTSGTATLETALFELPQVVIYKGSFISYQIAKRVVDKNITKYISLVNLIMDKEIVKELIQNNLKTVNLKNELTRITENETYRQNLKNDYKLLKEKLGGAGASEKTAKLILSLI
ncbi:MAG: lipid-A-disaccharide synthase [Bacteroidetes bacterium]|nr:lipid-A-disaccharide synthase [Bacteroidota bacterium]MBL7104640.1 lipid-A-disaccharide synthase [Bacteroidales bacterium]